MSPCLPRCLPAFQPKCVLSLSYRCLLPTSSTEVRYARKIHFVSTVLTFEVAWLNNEHVLGQYCPPAVQGKTQYPYKKVDPRGKRAFPEAFCSARLMTKAPF